MPPPRRGPFNHDLSRCECSVRLGGVVRSPRAPRRRGGVASRSRVARDLVRRAGASDIFGICIGCQNAAWALRPPNPVKREVSYYSPRGRTTRPADWGCPSGATPLIVVCRLPCVAAVTGARMRWLALALVVRSATTTTCPGTAPTDDTPAPVAGCSFDHDWCGWNATSNEGTRWTLGTETTPTRFTGPNEGVNGTGYAYVEASHPNHPSVVFELTSPLFETPASSLSFAYSMYGAAMGSLAVDIHLVEWICRV